jgi:hypothetical protein
MNIPLRSAAILLASLAAATVYASDDAAADRSALAWPATTQTTRPWTRWWWHGSAVDKENLTRCLEAYHAAGLGGVEITCIYGVQGQEHRDIQYLSDQWLDVVRHAINEAKRLEMGVDLPPGSGWRIGGPGVKREDGNADVVLEKDQIDGGATYQKTYSKPLPQAIVAFGPGGKVIELTKQLDSEGNLSWRAPEADGPWTVYSLGMKRTGERVKRAGPGGEGRNINPYARQPIEHFLEAFGSRIDLLPKRGLRASFHDSFEYEGSWCDGFLDAFRERRGYRLEQHLPALNGDGNPETVARTKSDYRETISDLVLANLIEPWAAWSRDRGMLARNQAHGSPGNWLDLYAAADIPETESFGRFNQGDDRLLLFKFASSAAHVAGRRLVSSETATWLDEHFTVTLGQIKRLVDQQFLGGINHTIYHGTAYSPADAAWPGWLFYASTQLNPQNPIWRDLPALNRYIARCQSMLQSSRPDNDLLLYWPIHDVWHHPQRLRENLTVHNAASWLFETPFGQVAKWLDASGYAFDYVSDRSLSECRIEDGRITGPGASYRAVLVPRARFMPGTTLQKLRELAESGGQIVFLDALPQEPAGLATAARRREFDEAHMVFEKALGQSQFDAPVSAAVGRGQLIGGKDINETLKHAGVHPESCRTAAGIQYVRRNFADGTNYFLTNSTETRFDGWVSLNRAFRSAALMDAMTGRTGLAAIKDDHRVRLQLNPWESVFIRAFDAEVAGKKWFYESHAADPFPIKGRWKLAFVAGGPQLPPAVTIDEPSSWTNIDDVQSQRFAGTATYSIVFARPLDEAERFILDLGQVKDSARVILNGEEVATLIGPPYRAAIGPLRSENNELRIEVTNVAANRIRDLDRRRVPWRIFHDINFVNIDYKPFDASNWPIRDAGLLGPVTLRPIP